MGGMFSLQKWKEYKEMTIPQVKNECLLDKDNKPLAVVSNKLASIHDKFTIDIYNPEEEGKIVSLMVCLQHILSDRAMLGAAAASSIH